MYTLYSILYLSIMVHGSVKYELMWNWFLIHSVGLQLAYVHYMV